MRFVLLLRVLAFVLQYASKHNTQFKNFIGNVSVSIAIKTKNNKGRTFIFSNGTVGSTSLFTRYDAALVFSDAKTGFRVLKEGTQEASFYAAATGNLHVEGMAFFIQWFNDAVTIAMKKNK